MFLTLLLAATTAITPQAQPDPTIASTKTATPGSQRLRPQSDRPGSGRPARVQADARHPLDGAALRTHCRRQLPDLQHGDGQKPEMQDIEKTKTTKADLKTALEASFKFCEAGFDGLTTATATRR